MSASEKGGISIRQHPNKDEIDERLLAGESVSAVEAWLKQKFSRNKKLQVNRMTLQAYRKNFLNLDGNVLAELREERQVKLMEEKKRKALEVAQAAPAYQLAKAKYAESYALQISQTNQKLEECYIKLQERLSIMEGEKIHHLNDKVILEQIRLMKDILKDAHEMERHQLEDQQTNINIDIGQITKQMQVLKVAVRETITELCPEIWPAFFGKLNEKLEAARVEMMQSTESEEEELEIEPKVNINIKA